MGKFTKKQCKNTAKIYLHVFFFCEAKGNFHFVLFLLLGTLFEISIYQIIYHKHIIV